jgi:hypothetical protein
MTQGNNVTYKIAFDQGSRGQFADNGTLDNSRGLAPDFPISYNEVFAISRDLGTIQSTQAPVVWTVGYTTEPAVNYIDLSGAPPTPRSPYYKTKYSNDETLASIDGIALGDHMSDIIFYWQIVDFLDDFSNASSRAQQLDQEVLQNATSVSNMLGDLVSLAIAQVYGSTQLTVGIDASGNPNSSDVMMFMKNIGGVQAR